jgi:hypothetical protein
MVLGMSPEMEVNLTKTNMYNVNVTDQLKKNFRTCVSKPLLNTAPTQASLCN